MKVNSNSLPNDFFDSVKRLRVYVNVPAKPGENSWALISKVSFIFTDLLITGEYLIKESSFSLSSNLLLLVFTNPI